ncbi:DUF6923 family protein, partial [Bacillus cereus]
MPATIQGIVFNDLNGNGTFDPGEPGIPSAVVVLQDPNGVCTSVLTNAVGTYSFSGLTIPGTYIVYETVQNPGGTCPPTAFTQPSGFNTSSTPRVGNLTVSQVQINNNQVLNGPNFGHQSIEVWTCDAAALQVAGSPSDMFSINLVTGVSTLLGAITPSGQYNAIGFNVLDNTIWGYNQSTGRVIRINPDLTANSFNIPNLNTALFNVGDIDLNGYLYITQQATSRFYVIDVNPSSPTYLQLVDPTLGFIIDTAPFGTAFSPAISTIVDWAFNPIDNQLYAVNSSGIVITINPLTGVVTNLTTNGIPAGLYGAAFFDSASFFYAINNTTGKIYRITLNALTATGVVFSQSVASGNNDGARCPLAPISLLTATKSVDKVTAAIGEILTYTFIVTNISTTVTTMNAILTDSIPVGTSFVAGSVTVNGIPNAGDPNLGILLGNIAPQDAVTVTFQVKIDNSPPSTITNSGIVSADNSGSTPSNEVITQIISIPIASLTSNKTVNQATANIGDVLTYTVVLSNTGNISADNTLFTDPIPNGMTFVANSVTVNGVPTPGVNPATGFTVGTIAPSASVTVSFQVTVT